MKPICIQLAAILLAASCGLFFSSCCKDDDEKASRRDHVEVNGKSYIIVPNFYGGCTWDEDAEEGAFCVPILRIMGKTTDCLFYEFQFESSRIPQVGDDFSKMSLALDCFDNPKDLSRYKYYDYDDDSEYEYVSGTAVVTEVDKSENDMTIKFNNLIFECGVSSYTFNGEVTIKFDFYSSYY